VWALQGPAKKWGEYKLRDAPHFVEWAQRVDIYAVQSGRRVIFTIVFDE